MVSGLIDAAVREWESRIRDFSDEISFRSAVHVIQGRPLNSSGRLFLSSGIKYRGVPPRPPLIACSHLI